MQLGTNFSENCIRTSRFTQNSLKYVNFKKWIWIQQSLKPTQKLKFTKLELKTRDTKNKTENFFY